MTQSETVPGSGVWKQLFETSEAVRNFYERNMSRSPRRELTISQLRVMSCIFFHDSGVMRIKDIAEDGNINPFIFDMTKVDDFKVIVDKIIELASNIQRFVRVTEHNISTVFEYFLNNNIDIKEICDCSKYPLAKSYGVKLDAESNSVKSSLIRQEFPQYPKDLHPYFQYCSK